MGFDHKGLADRISDEMSGSKFMRYVQEEENDEGTAKLQDVVRENAPRAKPLGIPY